MTQATDRIIMFVNSYFQVETSVSSAYKVNGVDQKEVKEQLTAERKW